MLTAIVNCKARMISSQFSVLQLVSHHVIKNQEIGFKTFGTELWRMVGLHQILAGNVNAVSSSGVAVRLERNALLRLSSNCN